MKSCKTFIILFASICLSFNASAQYKKLLIGERSPFDTAIAVHISEYRTIRFKVTYADSLINSLNAELQKSRTISQKKDSAQSILIAMQASNARTIAGQAETIQHVNKSFEDLFTAVNRPKKFFEKPLPLLGGGFAIGILSVALIRSVVK